MMRTSFLHPVAVVLVLIGLTFVSILPTAPTGRDHPGAASAGAMLTKSVGPLARPLPGIPIADGGTARFSAGNGTASVLTDQVYAGTSTNHTRSYSVHLNASVALPWLMARVTTIPLARWASPTQFPGGPDNLPPVYEWQWTVWRGPVNDTPNWTSLNATGALSRGAPWVAADYRIVGTSFVAVTLSVDGVASSMGSPTRVGVVLRNPDSGGLLPLNDSDTSDVIGALHPSLLRISIVSAATVASWDGSRGVPRFNFTQFDAAVHLASNLGAQVYLSLPVGTWGDGNILPPGMPLDSTLSVTYQGAVGRFPSAAAYASYVGAVVNHSAAMGASITYWNVGNEMPLSNWTVVRAYETMFNVAERAIHAGEPAALVGSDVMMDPTYLSEFARNASNVGFLSFHYYPALGLCLVNGSYCPPKGGTNGTTDPQLFRTYSDITRGRNLAPSVAQSRWYNGTHRWLPVLDSESNLNGVGGSVFDGALGTDPRQQTLLAASWLGATLVRASSANVSTLTYYDSTGPTGPLATATYPFGGWGFGLTAEGAGDQDIRYAPYWSLALWGQAGSGGAVGIPVSGDPSGVVRSYATRSTTTISTVVVNTVNVPVVVTVNVSAPLLRTPSVRILDQRSYLETYNSTLGTETLLRWGVTNSSAVSSFEIDGYGVALVTQNFTSNPPAGSPFGSPESASAIVLAVGIVVAAVVVSLSWLPTRHRRTGPRSTPRGRNPLRRR